MCEVANAIIITLNVHSSLIMITFHFFCPIPFYSSSPSAFPFHTVGIYRTEGGGGGNFYLIIIITAIITLSSAINLILKPLLCGKVIKIRQSSSYNIIFPFGIGSIIISS